MDILLIEPPYKALKSIGSEYGYSISTVNLAAYLQNNGISTAILSGNLLSDLPSQASFSFDVRKYAEGQKRYKEILADNTHPIWRKLSETIQDCRPKIVGITYLTPMMHSAQKVAALTKEIDENIIVIAGGHHPTYCPEETLESPNIDIAVRGEGEIPLLKLCNAFLSGNPDLKNIPGIHFKENGNIIGNAESDMIPDLDSLPFPARELVLSCDYSRYRLHYVITARGCPYNCTFCSDKELWKGKVRRRSLKNVMEEIKQLNRNYDVKYVDIVDGTFTYDRRYLTEFCNAMIQEELDIKWRCSARYDNLDQEIIDLMKRSNCSGLYLGLESGSQKILNSIDKKTTVDDIIKTSEIIYQSGITSVTAILMGLPQEDAQDIEDTLELMTRIKTSIFDINNFVPLPGTPLYDGQNVDWKKVGFKSFENHFTNNISKEALRGYINRAYEIAEKTLKQFIDAS